MMTFDESKRERGCQKGVEKRGGVKKGLVSVIAFYTQGTLKQLEYIDLLTSEKDVQEARTPLIFNRYVDKDTALAGLLAGSSSP